MIFFFYTHGFIERAIENKSILQDDAGSGRGGASGERRAIGKELRRRMSEVVFIRS
jgi:hypothetical protein